jgi:gas vesicle protein
MTDDQQTTSPAGAQNTEPRENRIPQSRFDEVVSERNDLKARLAKLEEAQQRAEQSRMADEKRYQELADSYKGELERIKPVVEQVDEWKSALRETAQTHIAQLPEDARDLVPEYDDPRQTLAWLNKNAAKLMRPSAPAMDAGQRGDTPAHSSVKLSSEQESALAQAQRVDPTMTRERYIAALIKLQGGG